MGSLRNKLKPVGSQIGLTTPLGAWAQAVTNSLESLLAALGVSSGGGSAPPNIDLDVSDTKRAGFDQAGVTTGTDIILNNVIFVRGTGIAYDFNTGIWTLTPGKVYELDAGGAVANFSSAAGGFLEIDWVDASTNLALFGNIAGIYKPSTQTNASSNGGRTRAVFIAAGASDARVKLRCLNATGTADIPADFFGCIVKQLR